MYISINKYIHTFVDGAGVWRGTDLSCDMPWQAYDEEFRLFSLSLSLCLDYWLSLLV